MHKSAEEQINMTDMPGNLIGPYMGLVIQFGLLIFFAPVFAFGVVPALLTQLFSQWMQVQNITKHWKRDKPSGDFKIYFWLGCIEGITYLSVLTRLAIIYFV
jgi:hypothetical protein